MVNDEFFVGMKKTIFIISTFVFIASSCANRRYSYNASLQQLTNNLELIKKYSNVDTASFLQLENIRSINLPKNVRPLLWIDGKATKRQKRRNRIANIEQAIQWLEVHRTTDIYNFALYELSHYKQVEDGFLVKGTIVDNDEMIQHYCYQNIHSLIFLVGYDHNVIRINSWKIDRCPNKPTKDINVTVHFSEFENADIRLPKLRNGTIDSHLSENLRYPVIALENSIQGTEIVSFTVETDGFISNIETIQSVDPSLHREVIRCIMMTDGREIEWQREYPYFKIMSEDRDNSKIQWIPGMKNGEKIPMKIIVEVKFSFDLGDHPSVIPFRRFLIIDIPSKPTSN